METAESADEGLARLKAESFDLVAIDHHMPGKNGREMLDEIVALPDHPPVVFVTGDDSTQVAVEAIHAGASDFVVKTVGESFFDLLDGRFRQAFARFRLEKEKRETEAELRRANERLEMLVREVHHRVSNSLQMVLSFVSMQANQTDEPAARDALESTQNRIKAISKVHHNLYTRGDLSTIDLDAYLGTLVGELREGLADDDGGIQLELTADPVEVSPDEAVAIGVVVNELVSNAIKYAFSEGAGGTVTITLEQARGGYSLTVADDGRGFASDCSPQGSGIGMRILRAVTASLGSSIERIPSDVGTCQRLTVTRSGS